MAEEWKIYTRTGDKGETSLIGGRRVPKYHERIEAYGTLDELNAFVAYLRDSITSEEHRQSLLIIEEEIFIAESILATDPETEINRSLPRLTEEKIQRLELEIDHMNEVLPPLSNFILPGGHPQVSLCHIARTICRRAERLCIKLDSQTVVDPVIIRYLNRLSDYFFVLARHLALLNRVSEIPWKP